MANELETLFPTKAASAAPEQGADELATLFPKQPGREDVDTLFKKRKPAAEIVTPALSPDVPTIGPSPDLRPTKLDQQLIDERINFVSKRHLDTNIFRQFQEGFTGPTTELVGGLAAIATGNKKFLQLEKQLMTSPFIPFDQLSKSQKTAFITGTIGGYVLPGTILSKGVKTLLKGSISLAGKEALIRESQKKATKYVGEKLAKTALPDVAKGVIGKGAGNFIKSGPALALEGAAWEGIASGGDLERTIDGAILFPLGGALISGSAELIGPAIRKGLPLIKDGTIKMSDALVKQATRLSRDEVGALFPKAKKMPAELMVSTEPGTNRLVTEASVKQEVVLGAEHTAQLETITEFRNAKIFNMVKQGNTRVLVRENELNRLLADKMRALSAVALNKGMKTKAIFPDSIGSLRISDAGKETIKDRFGSIQAIRAISKAEGTDFMDTMVKAGVSIPEASRVQSQMKFPTITLTNLDDAATSPEVQNQLRTLQIGKLDQRILNVQDTLEKFYNNIQRLKENPFYRADANPEVLKQSQGVLKRAKFLEQLEANGIDPFGIQELNFPSVRKYTERHSFIEEQLGLPIGQVTLSLKQASNVKANLGAEAKQFGVPGALKKLQKLGVADEEVTRLMHYVEMDRTASGKGRVFWNPEELNLANYKIPKFKGEAPSSEVQDELFKLRRALEWGYDINLTAGNKIGYLPRYVGSKRKVVFKKGTLTIGGLDVKSPGFLQKRTSTSLAAMSKEESKFIETRFSKLMPRMMNDSINGAAHNEMLSQINSVNWILRNTGHINMADEFNGYVDRAMGYSNNLERVDFMASDAVRKNQDWVDNMVSLATKEESAGKSLARDVNREIYNAMYHSFIGQSHNVLIKQFLQPEFVSATELGIRNVLKAKSLVGGKTLKLGAKETRKNLERVKSRLLPARIDPADLGRTQRTWLRFMGNVMNLPGKPGIAVFTKLDKLNREITFTAARLRFEPILKEGNARKITEAMIDLEQSERTRVINAFNNKGIQEALDVEGIIRAERANFAYNMADKPKFFAEGVGKLMPFTTWTVNQWERHLSNLNLAFKGEKAPLARRLAIPIIGVMGIEYAFNTKIYSNQFPPRELRSPVVIETKNYAPQSSLFAVFDFSPFVAYKSLLTGDGISWINAVRKIERSEKKRIKEDRAKKKGGISLRREQVGRQIPDFPIFRPRIIRKKVKKKKSKGISLRR